MLRNKLSDRIFFRTMFSAFGLRPVDWKGQTMILYFQYEIGPYSTDYLLHFRREPYWELYKNEIFNKLDEFRGYDLARYLNFHYQRYADKVDFLQFLRYETDQRIKRLGRGMKEWRVKLEIVLTWVSEQELALDRPVDAPAPATLPAAPAEETGVEILEAGMKEVAQSLSGRIVVSDERNLDRIIQLLLLLKEVRAPGKPIWPLFRRFKQSDIASIMHQFEAFKGTKTNTVEKRVIKCSNDLQPADPKAAQLTKALTDFFY